MPGSGGGALRLFGNPNTASLNASKRLALRDLPAICFLKETGAVWFLTGEGLLFSGVCFTGVVAAATAAGTGVLGTGVAAAGVFSWLAGVAGSGSM